MSSELTSPSTAVSFLLRKLKLLKQYLIQNSLKSHFYSCENLQSFKSSFWDLTQFKFVSMVHISLETKKIIDKCNECNDGYSGFDKKQNCMYFLVKIAST